MIFLHHNFTLSTIPGQEIHIFGWKTSKFRFAYVPSIPYMVARNWVFLTSAIFRLHAQLLTDLQKIPCIWFYYQSLYVMYITCRCDLAIKINRLFVLFIKYRDSYNFFDSKLIFLYSQTRSQKFSSVWKWMRRDTTINFDAVFSRHTTTGTHWHDFHHS